MTVRLFPALTLVAFTLPAAARGQDEEARAVVARAVRAHGGDKFLQIKAVQSTGKATIGALGVKVQTTDARWVQFPDRIKSATQLTVNGITLSMGFIYDGKKGWIQAMDKVQDMDDMTLKEMREQTMFLEQVYLLRFVKDKGCKLSLVGEGKVEDRPALGVRLECKDRPAINLYFDKQTHLLVKTERPTKNPGGADVVEEKFFKDYKAVDGIPRPFRVVVRHDGLPFAEWEAIEQQVLLEPFAENFFAKP
jgi:hypothetical protein